MERLALFTHHHLSLYLLILFFLFMRKSTETEHGVCMKAMTYFLRDSFPASWFSSIMQLFMGLWSFENDGWGCSSVASEGVVPRFRAGALWMWLNGVLIQSKTRILINCIPSNISQKAAEHLTPWVAWPWLFWGGVVAECQLSNPGDQWGPCRLTGRAPVSSGPTIWASPNSLHSLSAHW